MSLAAQTEYYEKKISEHPGWQFVRVYADDGISGLRAERSEGFNRMIEGSLTQNSSMCIARTAVRKSSRIRNARKNCFAAMPAVITGGKNPYIIDRKAYYGFVCPNCGKEFRTYGNSKRKYCCHEATSRIALDKGLRQ